MVTADSTASPGGGEGGATNQPDSGPVLASYVLPLPDAADSHAPPAGELAESLSEPLLVENVLWFCRLRWGVVAALLVFGVLGYFRRLVQPIGLGPPGAWPLVAAAILLAGNAVFLAHARVLLRPAPPRGARANLWGQIVLDLLVLTAVVHFLSGVYSYIPFAYLFHIVLACIFFSRGQSLAVTALACVLYAGCVALEHAGFAGPAAAADGANLHGRLPAAPGVFMVNFLSAIAIWLGVWYLASKLSAMVRQRDLELAATNRLLEAAQRDRSRHMLTTTHQLKAPFAAIDANTQLLQGGYCGTLPEEARAVVDRIAARSRRLAREIQEMLQLANLSSDSQQPPTLVRLDLAEVIRWCMHQLEPTIGQRRILIRRQIESAPAFGVEDHLRMMFTNLLANAVIYSHPGGTVTVTCRLGPDGQPLVTVADEGIGIAPEKLPRIFDEHYRTTEAVQHNKESSGLGLAIVRQVAEQHRIRLCVTSRFGRGTTFELRFPAPSEADSSSLAPDPE